MVTFTLTLTDEVVDGKEAVRLTVGHDIQPGDSHMGVTPAMRAAAFLIQTYKDGGEEVGEQKPVLEGIEKVEAEAPAVLDPFPGNKE